MEQVTKSEFPRPSFWNDSRGVIALTVVACEATLEIVAQTLDRFTGPLAAHLLGMVVVASVGFTVGTRILSRQQSFRSHLKEEIKIREAAQAKVAEAARELAAALKQVEQHNERLLSFSQFTHQLLSSTSDADIFGCIPRYAMSLFPGSVGALYRPEPTGNWRATCSWPQGCGLPLTIRAAGDASPAEITKAVQQGATNRRSLVCPLLAGVDLFGAIYLEIPAGVDENAAKRMSYMTKAFGDEISVTFANSRLRAQLSQQATRDPLTGLFNRRYMEEALAREIKRAARQGASLSLLMIDLDHFKQLNDQFGHDCGDAVLKGLGETILLHSREDDIACRYGGEEIVLVLPNTPVEGAVAKAQQLRSKIRKLIALTKQRRAITASIGVAGYPQDGMNAEALLKSADLAMYAAKQMGRDRVCRSKEVVLPLV